MVANVDAIEIHHIGSGLVSRFITLRTDERELPIRRINVRDGGRGLVGFNLHSSGNTGLIGNHCPPFVRRRRGVVEQELKASMAAGKSVMVESFSVLVFINFPVNPRPGISAV